MGEVDGRGQENQKQKKGEMGANETEDKREKYTLHSKKKERGAQARGEKRRRTQVCHKYVSMCVGRRPEHYSQCHYRSSAHKHLEIFTKAAPA